MTTQGIPILQNFACMYPTINMFALSEHRHRRLFICTDKHVCLLGVSRYRKIL